jgi:RND family efflux transporter MFP subunit
MRMTAAGFLLVAAATAACSHEAPEEVSSETVVPVAAEAATTGTITAIVHATGLVTPAPGADLLVVAPETARVAELPKAEGDLVHRGDLLVRFEIPTLAADVGRQKAEVDRAGARIDNAKAARTRAHELFERGIAARKEAEDADRELADAEADLASARAALAAAETAASRTTVRATFDGVVAKRAHNPGDLVEPSAGDAVLRVVDPRRIEMTAAIPIGDASRVKVGAMAHMLSPSATLKVISRPAAVEEGTASVPVRLQMVTPANVPIGAPAEVDIDAEEHAGVVLIPLAALMHEGSDTFVYVASGDKAERRQVSAGVTDGVHVEVTSGLRAGEMVITRGQAGLPDGAAISVSKAGS